MLDNNQYEKEVFDRYPELQEKVLPLINESTFNVLLNSNEKSSEVELRALYTPGHASDHFSLFLQDLKGNSFLNGETILFSGDIILGAPSTSI